MSDEYNRQLFGEIKEFVPIKILDKEYKVPLRLELLRVFQFLDFDIDYARLCWNGSCQRCVVSYETQTSSSASGTKMKRQEALSCRLKSCETMNLLKLPATIKPKG